MARHGVSRERSGAYRVRLSREERALLGALPAEFGWALSASSPVAHRLFPAAHPDDPVAEESYRDVVGSSLVDGKRAALAELTRTADADRLSEAELEAWLGALETLRLTVGTELDVTEETHGWFDPSDPEAPRLALYHWLSWLQEECALALLDGLE